MSEPTKEEINKTIAEYMGITNESLKKGGCLCTMRESCTTCSPYERKSALSKYTDSLDALVPVWEKLYCDDNDKMYNPNEMFFIMVRELMERSKWVLINDRSEHGASELTIQHAAALATYRAIKELGEK